MVLALIEGDRQQAVTAGTTQDFIVSGMTHVQPKAALFVVSGATSSAQDHKRLSYGLTDGVRQGGVSGRDEDGVSSASNTRRAFDDAVIRILDTTSLLTVALGVFQTWIPGGVRILWTIAPPEEFMVNFALWFGEDVEVFMDNEIPPRRGEVPEDVVCTDPTTNSTFEPDHLLTLATYGISELPLSTYDMQISHQINTGTGTGTGRHLLNQSSASVSTSKQGVHGRSNNEIAASIRTDQIPFQFIGTTILTAWNTDGFTLSSNGPSSTSRGSRVYFLAVKYGNNRVSLLNDRMATSLGTLNHPGDGWRSWSMLNSQTVVDDAGFSFSRDDNEAEGSAVGFLSNSGSEWTCGTTAADGVTTTNTSSYSTDDGLLVLDGSGTTLHKASCVFNSGDGVDANYTVVNANGRQFAYFLLEADEITGSGAGDFPLPTAEGYGVTCDSPRVGEAVILREATGLDNDTSTSFAAFSFDTEVQRDTNYGLVGSPATAVTCRETGHYLVAYNLGYQQNGGANRSETTARLVVNSVAQSYGLSSGYIRRLNQVNSIQSAMTILNVGTSGHAIGVQMARTDSNTTVNCQREANRSGLAILKLNDDWAYYRGRDATAQTLTNSSQVPPVTPASFTWNALLIRTDDEKDTGYDHSTTSNQSEITLEDPGRYLVCYQIRGNDTSTIRLNLLTRATLDGTPYHGSYASGFARGLNGVQDPVCSTAFIVETSTSDEVLVLQAALDSESVSTTLRVSDLAVTIVRLPDETDMARIRQDSDHDHNSATFDAISFNQNDILDSEYTHSTTVNPSRLSASTDGLHLLIGNFLQVRDVLDTTRKNPEARWRSNGTTELQYGSVSSFHRGDQLGTGTYTGAAGAFCLFNYTGSVTYVEMGGLDRASTADAGTSWYQDETIFQALSIPSIAPLFICGGGAMQYPLPTATGAGELTFVGTGAGEFPLPTATGDGLLSFDAIGAGSFPTPTATAAGLLVFTATATGEYPLPTATGVGTVDVPVIGAGAGDFPLPTAAAAGALVFTAVSAGNYPVLTGTGSGELLITATGAGSFPTPTATSAGLLVFTATATGEYPLPTGTGVGIFIPASIAGSGAGTFPLPLGTAAGLLVFVGLGVGTYPLPTALGQDTPRLACHQKLEATFDQAQTLQATYDQGQALLATYDRNQALDGSYDLAQDLDASYDEGQSLGGSLC